MIYNLNRLMRLEAPMQSADGAGGFTSDWAELGQLWVEMKRRSARDSRVAIGDISIERIEIITRAAPIGSIRRPQKGQRLVEGVTIFRIHSVQELGKEGLYLSLLATQEQAQ